MLDLRNAAALLGALLVLGLASATAAAAAPSATVDRSKKLWATINACDTPGHPDTVGIRASMPGSGVARERMFMRFQVQYFNVTDRLWHNIGPGGDSGFVSVGSAKYDKRETGRYILLTTPPAGQSYRVRGAVTFEWRRGDKVVRRARKRTRAGHTGTRGADPKDFSAAECTIRSMS